MFERSPPLKVRDDELSFRVDRKQVRARRIKAQATRRGPILLAQRLLQDLGFSRAVNAAVLVLV